MANHRSAEKRARQTTRRTVRNSRIRKSVRTCEKKLRQAIESKDIDGAKVLLRDFSSAISKMAQKGIVHLKNSSRKIGRLASQVDGLSKS